MGSNITKQIDDLSLLLVMTDGSDATGIEALIQLVHDLKASTEDARLVQCAEWAIETTLKLGGQEIITLVQDFVSSVQNYLNDPVNAKLVNEKSPDARSSELGEFFDSDFLPEFIEKHSMLLEELEGAVSEYRFRQENSSDDDKQSFNSHIKSYLHNIKGDAGSIGLIGIERVTHIFEDLLLDTEPCKALDSLLQYKEWVCAWLKALASGATHGVDSNCFIKELSDSLSFAVEASPPVSAEPSKPENFSARGEAYAVSTDHELLAEFIAEAEDHLNSVEGILLGDSVVLSAEDIDTIFRGVHSLKGASSYFNLLEVNESSHLLENLLDEVRDGKRKLDDPLKNLVLDYIDLQKQLLTDARNAASSDGLLYRSQAVSDYIQILKNYSEGKAAPQHRHESKDSLALDRISINEEPITAKRDKLGIKTFVKVDTNRLDMLIDSIGEMVIYSSMLIRACKDLLSDNEEIIKTTHQVEKFSRDLQEIGMSMRLDPIKGLFQKMSRLVWDVSKKLGKEINFSMRGEDTELDRTVIENLADPLMHMVRNAIDHGIELPDERERAGKPRIGTVELIAAHVGGSIQVQIKDDGKGLDPEKLIKKAIERGIVNEKQVLSEQECFQLIFHPGFSMAAAVTDISGRGVGMDVVRTNIESMRGSIHIESKVGVGSTFTIELPLTLAIIDGIETLVGSEHFIIPTLSILEFMKPVPELMSTTMGVAENFYFRGTYLPLFRVADFYNIEPKYTDPTEGIVVVVEAGGEQVAFLIDDIVGSCQTVIKSLGRIFGRDKGIAGCSIMPDGNIGLILDIRTLVQIARKRDYPSTNLRELIKRKSSSSKEVPLLQ